MIFGNLSEMMKQAHKLREEMAGASYEVEVSGVKVKVSGEMEILELKIPPEMSPIKAESSVKEAINRALKSAKDEMFKKLQKIAGGFPLPGIF